MLSLDNTYNEEELRDWERRVHELTGRSDVDYVCELKLDGMSLALIYEDGKLYAESLGATARSAKMSRSTCAPCARSRCRFRRKD
jgi:NAD-dependent DNA ligase